MRCSGFLAVAERLLVGPILKTLVFSTTPEVTRRWVDAICSDWDFTSIVPAVRYAPAPPPPPAPRVLPGACQEGVDRGTPLNSSIALPSSCVQHFTAPVRAGPADLRAAFAFVYEPQLSQERAAAAAAAAAAKSSTSSDAARAAAAAASKAAAARESANPAKALDGLLIGLLGGLKSTGGGGGGAQASGGKPGAAAAPAPGTYPAEDIAALDAAKRFLVGAGVVNK